MKRIVLCVIVVLMLSALVLPFTACSDNDAAETIASWEKQYTAGSFGIVSKKNPFVEFEISNGDSIRVELYPTVAPKTVANFVKYVKDGFYDGVAFHRIISGFMIQSGGFEMKSQGLTQKKATYSAIKGEFKDNGVTNKLSHKMGVISAARTDDMNSATSQFFICSANRSDLDGAYAAFGRVIDEESMSAVLRLASVATSNAVLYYGSSAYVAEAVPKKHVYIKKATLVWDN